jgi:fatty acid-binding protein DegV
MYALFTDTDCDVTPEIAKTFGYHLISLPYIENGKEVYPYEDWRLSIPTLSTRNSATDLF